MSVPGCFLPSLANHKEDEPVLLNFSQIVRLGITLFFLSSGLSFATPPDHATPFGGIDSPQVSTSKPARERIIDALESMRLPHERRPTGVAETVGWKSKPTIGMGTEPYASALKPFWKGNRFDRWRAMLSWFVIYEAEGGSPAQNSAVEIGGIEMWFFSISEGIWKRIQSDRFPSWHAAYSTNAIDKSNEKMFAEKRTTGLAATPTRHAMVHGGLSQVTTPWSNDPSRADLGAVFVSVKHRLVLKNPAVLDDRVTARLIVQAGADYYPFMGAKLADMGAAWVPGLGVGRFMMADKQWRYSTMIVVKEGYREAEILTGLPDRFDF